MNKVIFIGRLAREPQLKTLPTGAVICTFSIAVNRTSQAPADFFNITTWGRLAESCFAYLKTGSRVCVYGSLKISHYEVDKIKKIAVEITADDVDFLSPKKPQEEEAQ